MYFSQKNCKKQEPQLKLYLFLFHYVLMLKTIKQSNGELILVILIQFVLLKDLGLSTLIIGG